MPSNSGVVDFTAGGVGGILQVLVGHPFDTLKIQLVTGTQKGGIKDVARATLRNEGLAGFYKGVASPLIGLVAINAVLFTANGTAARFLDTPGEQMPMSRVLLGGMFAGVCVSFVEGPVDLFKTKMQVQVKDAHGNLPYRSTFHCATQIIKQYGLGGVYQGFIATQARNIISNALYFAVYEYLKRSFSKGGEATATHTFIAGGLSGMAYWSFTYPLDAVKSILQSQPSDPHQRQYQSYFQAVKKVYTNEGARGFFKGYAPCILRSFPANAACFVGYEAVKKYLFHN